MKLLLLILLFASCATKTPEPPVYHIKATCFGAGGLYVIHFTNDNWKSFADIKHVVDLRWARLGVSYDPKLFKTFSEAIEFAKQFKTYDSCISYNERTQRIYDSLIRKPEPPTCNELQVY
jgi:hypothetical protein